MEESFRLKTFFVARNSREAVRAGRADVIPAYLSEIPRMFYERVIPLDVALIAVSPPDEHGYCSLGVSIDLSIAACRSARIVLAEIQPEMPRTLGHSCLHVSEIDRFCMSNLPMIEQPAEPATDTMRQIASHIRELVRDGDCIQTGFGKLPSAVLEKFNTLNDLGIHTEMFADNIVPLVEAGNINCRNKNFMTDKAVCTFALGTKILYDAIDNNPFFEFHPTEFVNDPATIARNDNMVAINSAVQVDLFGQVVADSMNGMPYSGIGGQVDFIRGAGASHGGRPIIAFPSTAEKGACSRIVFNLDPGMIVTTPRADVHWVVTEFGAVNLFGKTLTERAHMLISVAHEDFRSDLLHQLRAKTYFTPSQ